MSNIFSTIDHDQLSNVTGGGSASSLVLNKLNDKFGSQGVVSYIGKPTFRSSGGSAGVENARGKFDVNALWGGDQKYTFDAKVNQKAGSVSDLHTKLIGSE
jgi:hypothetical protein